MTRRLHTIVETPEFLNEARRALNDAERKELVDFLAANPSSGDLMQGTGGARKLRWGAGSKGRRGGVRIISYYGGPHIPVFLLTVFAKGDRANLSKAERNELRKVLGSLAEEYAKGAS
jgi:mRNA-degrading endonuclease RelE of RelBE toxin-antitoxin system